MTGGQLGRKSFFHIQVDRGTALKVLHMQEEEVEECKQQIERRP